MLVIDNFFPKDLIDSVVLESHKQKWSFTRSDSNGDMYWTNVIFGSNYCKKEDITLNNFVSENVKKCWEFFKVKSNCNLNDDNLDSIYFNGLTYGTESHAHVDTYGRDLVTVIVYVCESWNSHWGGETVFFSGEHSKNPSDSIFYSHDIIKSVLPKNNRIVLFDGSIVHAVRPLSKSFKSLRKTLMFKIKNKRIEDFKNYAT